MVASLSQDFGVLRELTVARSPFSTAAAADPLGTVLISNLDGHTAAARIVE